jgi:hypothetical protein
VLHEAFVSVENNGFFGREPKNALIFYFFLRRNIMSKKLFLLISIVLVLGLFSSASAAPKFDYRVCWWSDLGPGHDWNEPNNWYTMDRYWNDADNDDDIDTLERKFYVKVHPNQVPDVNTVVLVGKGISGVDYPEYLHFNPPPVDPTISSGTPVASYLSVGGGYSLDPNKSGGGAQGAVDHGDPNHWDPCMYHELTITDGTLNIGEPQTWEGYDTLYGYGYFSGMYSGSSLLLGTVGWYIPELGAGKGQGTMHMDWVAGSKPLVRSICQAARLISTRACVVRCTPGVLPVG